MQDGILRNPSRTRFTIIDNVMPEDPRLSLEAKGLMCYLLSRPDHWVVRRKHLSKVGHCGRQKMQRIFRELTHAGYMETIKPRDRSGQFHGTIYRISENGGLGSAAPASRETPQDPDDQAESPETRSSAYHRETGFPTVGKSDPLVNTDSLANTDPSPNIHARASKRAEEDQVSFNARARETDADLTKTEMSPSAETAPSSEPSAETAPSSEPSAKAKPTSTQKRNVELPADFELTAEMAAYCRKKAPAHINPEHEFEQFCNTHWANGSRKKNWQAAWRTWVGNTWKYNPPRNNKKPADRNGQRAADTTVGDHCSSAATTKRRRTYQPTEVVYDTPHTQANLDIPLSEADKVRIRTDQKHAQRRAEAEARGEDLSQTDFARYGFYDFFR